MFGFCLFLALKYGVIVFYSKWVAILCCPFGISWKVDFYFSHHLRHQAALHIFQIQLFPIFQRFSKKDFDDFFCATLAPSTNPNLPVFSAPPCTSSLIRLLAGWSYHPGTNHEIQLSCSEIFSETNFTVFYPHHPSTTYDTITRHCQESVPAHCSHFHTQFQGFSSMKSIEQSWWA